MARVAEVMESSFHGQLTVKACNGPISTYCGDGDDVVVYTQPPLYLRSEVQSAKRNGQHRGSTDSNDGDRCVCQG